MRKTAIFLALLMAIETVLPSQVLAAQPVADEIVYEEAIDSTVADEAEQIVISDEDILEEAIEEETIEDEITEEIENLEDASVEDGEIEEASEEEELEAEPEMEIEEDNIVEADAGEFYIFDKAYKYPDGYFVAIFDFNGNIYGYHPVTVKYTVDDGEENVTDVLSLGNFNNSAMMGFYIPENSITEDKHNIKVDLNWTIQDIKGESTGIKIIEFIDDTDKDIIEYADAEKILSFGKEMHIEQPVYTGEDESITVNKIIATNNETKEEFSANDLGLFSQKSLYGWKFPGDPRYDQFTKSCNEGYSFKTPYTEYIEGDILFDATLPTGTYSLKILTDKKTYVLDNVLTVNNEVVVTDAGFAAYGAVPFDNVNGNAVALWVYGNKISKDTVPVLYSSAGTQLTGKVLATELLDNGKGLLYKLEKKSAFKYENQDRYLIVENAIMYDFNKEVKDYIWSYLEQDLYHVYSSSKEKETYQATFGVSRHDDCGLDRVRIYLNQKFAAVGTKISIATYDRAFEGGFVVKKDSCGRAYVDIDETSNMYYGLSKDGVTLILKNSAGIKGYAYCGYTEEELDNITCENSSWEILQANDVGNVLFDGNKGDTLTEEQINTLKGYDTVRINEYSGEGEDKVCVNQYLAVFATGEKPSVEDKIISAVENCPAPTLTLIKNSITGNGATFDVKIPADIKKFVGIPGLMVGLETEDLYGNTNTYEFFVNTDTLKCSIDYLNPMMQYKVRAFVFFEQSEETKATSKYSNYVSFTCNDIYEKKLGVKSTNAKVAQGSTEPVKLATLTWNTAREDKRTISSFSVSGKWSEDAQKILPYLTYDAVEQAIYFKPASLSDWNIKAGKYDFVAYANTDNTPSAVAATAKISVTVTQSVKAMTVIPPSYRYVMPNKNLVIKPKFAYYDYSGASMAASKVKLYDEFTLVDANGDVLDNDYITIDSIKGTVTIAKELNENIKFAIKAPLAGCMSDLISIYKEAIGIKSFTLTGTDSSKLQTGIQVSDLIGKQLVVIDDNGNEIPHSNIKYSVSGKSVTVNSYGEVSPTYKAGKSIIKATLTDGSKETATLTVNVIYDTIELSELKFEYVSTAYSDDNSLSMEEGIDKTNTLDLTNNISAGLFISNRITKSATVFNYKLKAKTGKLIDYRKASGEPVTPGSFSYLYVPTKEKDTITLTDNSGSTPVVYTYNIECPQYANAAKKISLKKNSINLYNNGVSETHTIELNSDADLSGKKCYITPDFTKYFSSSFANYAKLVQAMYYNMSMDGCFSIVEDNKINIDSGFCFDIKPGSYLMNIFIVDDNVKPIPLTVKVVKTPKANVSGTKKVWTITKGSDRVKLDGIKETNTNGITYIDTSNGLVGSSGRYENQFKEKFVVVFNETEQCYYLKIADGVDPKDIADIDKSGYIALNYLDKANNQYFTMIPIKIAIE